MSQDHRGECLHCHAPNSYALLNCHECGARLPWADALTQKLFEGQNAITPQTLNAGENLALAQDQETSLASKPAEHQRANWVTTLSVMCFLLGSYLVVVHAPFALWMAFMFAGVAVSILKRHV